MAKPYALGVSPQKSLRCVSPTYEQPNPRAPSVNFKWAPGFEQNQGPMGDVPIPMTSMAAVAKPFKLR